MCYRRRHDDHDSDIVYSQSVPSSLLDATKDMVVNSTDKSTTQKCATRAPSRYVFVTVFMGLLHIAMCKQLHSVVVHACLFVYDRTSQNVMGREGWKIESQAWVGTPDGRGEQWRVKSSGQMPSVTAAWVPAYVSSHFLILQCHACQYTVSPLVAMQPPPCIMALILTHLLERLHAAKGVGLEESNGSGESHPALKTKFSFNRGKFQYLHRSHPKTCYANEPQAAYRYPPKYTKGSRE